MTSPQKKSLGGWDTVGRLLAVLFVIFGLAALAFCIAMVVAFNNYGSNK